MTNEAIRNVLLSSPFEPFDIQMVNGQTFPVRHPEFVMAPKGSRTIVVHLGRDRYRLIDVFLIASLNFERSRRSPRNGRKKAG